MSPTWKPFQIERKNIPIPPLLIKCEFGTSSYKVWLTDLTYIWIESIDRRQIIQRAFDVETSIDPGEDASQLRLLLQSIQDALVQRTGTSVDFARSDNPKQLVLHTSTPLPGPLKPLEWRMTLISAPQSTLTYEFVIPLLSQQSSSKAEKASLLQQLKHKDNVITKLIERMQFDGVDLSIVFPGFAPVRSGGNARQVIAKSVKGLGEFDVQEWQSRMIRDTKTLEQLRDLILNTFDADPVEASTESQISDSPSYGDWWRNLTHENSERVPIASPAVLFDAEENGGEESEFQTQTPPPKLQAKPGLGKGKGRDPGSNNQSPNLVGRQESNGSTTDVSDFEVQPAKPGKASPLPQSANGIAQESPRAMVEATSQGPHTLSHRKEAVSKHNKGSESTDTTSSPEGDEMEIDEQHFVGSKPALSDKTSNTAAKPKPRLGKIGGKGNPGKANNNQAVSSPAKVARSTEPKVNGKPDSSRANRRQSPSKVSSEPARVGRATVQTRQPSPPRETSQERADRKREQLKRELESKGQAGTKKKRKF